MSINKKINDLFELRHLPELCQGTPHKKGSAFYKKLIKLQKAIYDLDAHLESAWDIRAKDLKKYWDDIASILLELDVPKSKHAEYLSLIKKYQKHELQLRDGKMPFEYTMEYYYYYKSCDVKLLRRLIYDRIPELSKLYQLSDWRLFDLITELHDDVEDVFEDQDSINGNSFLLCINSKGLKQTVFEFQEMINFIEWRLDEKYGSVERTSIKSLYKVTKNAIMHLNILIRNTQEKIKKDGIKQSKVLTLIEEGMTV